MCLFLFLLEEIGTKFRIHANTIQFLVAYFLQRSLKWISVGCNGTYERLHSKSFRCRVFFCVQNFVISVFAARRDKSAILKRYKCLCFDCRIAKGQNCCLIMKRSSKNADKKRWIIWIVNQNLFHVKHFVIAQTWGLKGCS